MPRLLRPSIPISIVPQQTESHCGPAVLQMVLSHLKKYVSQDQIVTAARARSRIKRHGTRPQHLARALSILAPGYAFWFKQNATVADLTTLVHTYQWPVVVNWQGLFYESDKDEPKHVPHGDFGHYSVVVGIDEKKDTIVLADPYPDYVRAPRAFSLQWFVKRWWDISSETDKRTGKKDVIKTRRFIFLVSPKEAEFPRSLHMQPPEKLEILRA